ncbi:hypothetical protein AJ88_46645 [Mesorhizobium amorphae CCBAU 01583]|nr:hypothetical protein AJ88_46645 [Mesorhizobium amorphae CCBAU 01583]
MVSNWRRDSSRNTRSKTVNCAVGNARKGPKQRDSKESLLSLIDSFHDEQRLNSCPLIGSAETP